MLCEWHHFRAVQKDITIFDSDSENDFDEDAENENESDFSEEGKEQNQQLYLIQYFVSVHVFQTL